MDAEARQVISRSKMKLPKLDVVVAKMSRGQRQAIAVARATVFARKVVILDEPTAALGLRESQQVLNLVATLRDHGNAVILITHNMEHVGSHRCARCHRRSCRRSTCRAHGRR
jgi:ABC-type sugar transport system ATPase subunit